MSIYSHKLGRNISADQKFDQILVQSIWCGFKLFFLCFSVRLSPYPMDNRVSALSSGGAGRGSAKHLTSASSGGRAASPKSLKASGLHQLQQQQGGFASQQSAVGGRIRRPTEQDEGRIRIGLSKSISLGNWLIFLLQMEKRLTSTAAATAMLTTTVVVGIAGLGFSRTGPSSDCFSSCSSTALCPCSAQPFS